jgi:hypothetical protein
VSYSALLPAGTCPRRRLSLVNLAAELRDMGLM